MIAVRELVTTLGVGGSPLPGMFTAVAGVPWQMAAVLAVLGWAAATAIALKMEANRQERYRMWIELVERKVKDGQDVDLNGALEDALAPPRQVATPGRAPTPSRRIGRARKAVQP